MDTELIKSKVEEINRLHQEVLGAVKMTLEKVVRVGELLTAIKNEIGYGSWMKWVKDNYESLGFGYVTANNYIHAYERKDDPRFTSDVNLMDIYYPQLEHKAVKVPPLPKEEDVFPEDKTEPKEKPEPLPVKLQPYVKDDYEEDPLPEEPEEEIEEPVLNEQDEMASDIEDLFQRLDREHMVKVMKDLYWKLDRDGKDQIIDWLFEQGRPARKAA